MYLCWDAVFLKKASTTTTKDHFQRKIGYVLEIYKKKDKIINPE